MSTASAITPHEAPFAEGEHFVASGSTSACYLLRRHGRLMLKKRLLPAFASDERHRAALSKEFELGYRLDHPHIPRYLEYHGDWLLMDYVDGDTLTAFLRLHPDYFRDKRHARQLVDELLSAVGYLHRHQLLHLDLKPDNIMITRIGGHVKLIDLGYCYQDSYPFSTGGTARYAAPDKEKSPASDIYSLGVIFSEIGVGRKAVVAKCLSPAAADRYQSVEELSSAMQPSHRWWLPVVAATLFMVLGGMAWWAWGGKGSEANVPTSQRADTTAVNSGTTAAVVDSLSLERETMLPSSTAPANQDVMAAGHDVSPSLVADRVVDTAPSSALDSIDANTVPTTGLRSRQMRELALFQPVTDSILAPLRQFVSDERMPYRLGSVEAYQTAYLSIKTDAVEHGKGSKNHFWMRIHWQKYDGKPKPYDPCEQYLYEQMVSLDALFQANIASYNRHQTCGDNTPQP